MGRLEVPAARRLLGVGMGKAPSLGSAGPSVVLGAGVGKVGPLQRRSVLAAWQSDCVSPPRLLPWCDVVSRARGRLLPRTVPQLPEPSPAARIAPVAGGVAPHRPRQHTPPIWTMALVTSWTRGLRACAGFHIQLFLTAWWWGSPPNWPPWQDVNWPLKSDPASLSWCILTWETALPRDQR